VDFDDVAVTVPEPGDAVGDVQVLAAGVGVPGGAGSGLEADLRHGGALLGPVRGCDDVQPHSAGELCFRVQDGLALGFDNHDFSFQPVLFGEDALGEGEG
jgi:hypothetical protein